MFLFGGIFLLTLAVLPSAIGTAIAVRTGLNPPARLSRIARYSVLIVTLALGFLGSSGWIEWKYGRETPHKLVGGFVALCLLTTTPMIIGGVFSATKRVSHRVTGLAASIALPIAVGLAIASPAANYRDVEQSSWIAGFRSTHMILAPIVSGMCVAVLLFVLRSERPATASDASLGERATE